MIDLDACRQIEYELLGCHLEDVPTGEIEAVLDNNSLSYWRQARAATENAYIDSVRMLFKRTRNKFDWGALISGVNKSSDGTRQERPHPWPDPPETEVEKTKRIADDVAIAAIKMEDPERFVGDPYSLEFMDMCKLLEKLQIQKGRIYKTSWREDGDVGVYANIARKFHRIRHMVKSCCRNFDFEPALMPKGAESYTEAIADEAVYCILDMVKMKHDHPEEHEDWKERNKLS